MPLQQRRYLLPDNECGVNHNIGDRRVPNRGNENDAQSFHVVQLIGRQCALFRVASASSLKRFSVSPMAEVGKFGRDAEVLYLKRG